MSNMSYCRFQNTLGDLRDCADNIDAECGLDEARARVHLLILCAHILDTYTVEDARADLERIKADNSQFGVGA